MILQSLHALYDRLKDEPDYQIAPPGYSPQKISFKVVLKPEGELFNLQSLRRKVVGKDISQQLIVPGGAKPTGKITKKSVHKKVCFLRNDLPFVVGAVGEEVDDPETGKKKVVLAPTAMTFEAFKKYHLKLEEEIDDSGFSAVCRFLEDWKPKQVVDHAEWVDFSDGQGVFQILGEQGYVHERPAVRAWWDSQQETEYGGTEYCSQCLITGNTLPVARLHEPKIKSVKGAQSSGAPIVSFDKDSDAFSSYGKNKQQGYNAPVSQNAAFRYATALNALLDGPMSTKHRMTLADATVIFWTDRPTLTEDIFASFSGYGSAVTTKEDVQDEGLRQKIDAFLRALRKGSEAYADVDEDPDQTMFYILGLTGQAKGRLGVRFFYRGTVRELLDNLRRHFDDIRVEPQFGEGSKSPDPEFPSLRRLLDETCPFKKGKPDRDKIPPILSGPLLRSVIIGKPYPQGLFASVIRRIHADRKINYCRASIIKGYLTRNMKKEVKMSLDTGSTEHAYRLGRLFAVLEKIQEEGFYQQTKRKLEHSIRETYFSAACSTPASVFPRLERLSTHHRRHLPIGRKIYFDKLISDIWWELTAPVSVLTIKDQGLFVMGYYHQRKALFQIKQENIQNNEEE